VPKDVEVVYCSASEKYCIIICLKSSRSTLSKPSKAQATPIPAFSVYCKIENCKKIDQNLLPIKDWDSQEERNPWVSLKAKVIQASTQLNPVREILFLVFLVTQLRSWVSVRPNCTTIGVWSIRNINSKPKLVAILLWWQPLINSLFFRFQFGNNASDLHSAPISRRHIRNSEEASKSENFITAFTERECHGLFTMSTIEHLAGSSGRMAE